MSNDHGFEDRREDDADRWTDVFPEFEQTPAAEAEWSPLPPRQRETSWDRVFPDVEPVAPTPWEQELARIEQMSEEALDHVMSRIRDLTERQRAALAPAPTKPSLPFRRHVMPPLEDVRLEEPPAVEPEREAPAEPAVADDEWAWEPEAPTAEADLRIEEPEATTEVAPSTGKEEDTADAASLWKEAIESPWSKTEPEPEETEEAEEAVSWAQPAEEAEHTGEVVWDEPSDGAVAWQPADTRWAEAEQTPWQEAESDEAEWGDDLQEAVAQLEQRDAATEGEPAAGTSADWDEGLVDPASPWQPAEAEVQEPTRIEVSDADAAEQPTDEEPQVHVVRLEDVREASPAAAEEEIEEGTGVTAETAVGWSFPQAATETEADTASLAQEDELGPSPWVVRPEREDLTPEEPVEQDAGPRIGGFGISVGDEEPWQEPPSEVPPPPAPEGVAAASTLTTPEAPAPPTEPPPPVRPSVMDELESLGEPELAADAEDALWSDERPQRRGVDMTDEWVAVAKDPLWRRPFAPLLRLFGR